VIANYGYQDGSGTYLITIDTACCLDCAARGCLSGCPEGMFAVEVDDYDDEVAIVVERARRQLKERCAGCKPSGGYDRERLPCVTACRPGAISHSW